MNVCICKKHYDNFIITEKRQPDFIVIENKRIYTLIYKSLKNSRCLTIVNLETSIR